MEKRFDFTSFVVFSDGSIETKRVRTNSEKYLFKNLIPKMFDGSGNIYSKYFKSCVFYVNNDTNEFIDRIYYEFAGGYEKELIFEIIYNEYEIEYYKNLIN